MAYRTKIREATRGHTHYPAVRTFRAFPESTNSVYHDLTTASTWSDTPIPLYFLYCVKTSIKDYWKCLILRISDALQSSPVFGRGSTVPLSNACTIECVTTCREGVGENVDISDLTWEQKEQVLRLLFSKINETTPTPKPRPLPPTSSLRYNIHVQQCMIDERTTFTSCANEWALIYPVSPTALSPLLPRGTCSSPNRHKLSSSTLSYCRVQHYCSHLQFTSASTTNQIIPALGRKLETHTVHNGFEMMS